MLRKIVGCFMCSCKTSSAELYKDSSGRNSIFLVPGVKVNESAGGYSNYIYYIDHTLLYEHCQL